MPGPAGCPPRAAPAASVAEQISLRNSVSGDEAFLRILHADSHPELATLDLAPEGITHLLDLQITAQQSQYLAAYPAARDQLVCVAEHPVGRCWTHQSDAELRLLDLAILTRHRRHGIARGVLHTLCHRAETKGVPVRLHVWHANAPAQRLYARMGFRSQAQAAGYLAMEWLPGTAAPEATAAPETTRRRSSTREPSTSSESQVVLNETTKQRGPHV